jgi:hypothetical protein
VVFLCEQIVFVGVELVDQESLNGCFVNRVRIRKTRLSSKDVIVLGSTEIDVSKVAVGKILEDAQILSPDKSAMFEVELRHTSAKASAPRDPSVAHPVLSADNECLNVAPKRKGDLCDASDDDKRRKITHLENDCKEGDGAEAAPIDLCSSDSDSDDGGRAPVALRATVPRNSGTHCSPIPEQVARVECRYVDLGCESIMKNRESEASHACRSCKFRGIARLNRADATRTEMSADLKRAGNVLWRPSQRQDDSLELEYLKLFEAEIDGRSSVKGQHNPHVRMLAFPSPAMWKCWIKVVCVLQALHVEALQILFKHHHDCAHSAATLKMRKPCAWLMDRCLDAR